MTARKVLFNLRGLGFAEETVFGTDPTGQVAIRSFDSSFEPKPNMIDVPFTKTEPLRGPDARIKGGLGGTLKFKSYLRAYPGYECPCLSLMKRMGATLYSCAAGSGKVTAGTSVTIRALEGDLASITAIGQAVLHVPVSGTTSLRFVTRIQLNTPTGNDTTITVNAAFATTPGVGDSFAAVDTIMPTAGDPAKYFSFNFWQGSNAGSDCIKWIVSGCSGKWALDSVTAGGIPVISFEMECDNYSFSEAGTTTAADAVAPGRPILGDKFMVDGAATDIKSLSFDPQMEMVVLDAVSGSNGRSGFTFVGCSPKMEVDPLHDTGWQTKLEVPTMFDAQFESIFSATSAWGIWIPGAYVDACPEEDSNGIMRRKLTIVGRDPGKNTDSAVYPLWALAVTK